MFDTPSAASSTIRARCASPARTDDDRVNRVSSSRSPSRSPNAGAGRFPQLVRNSWDSETTRAANTSATAVRVVSSESGHMCPYVLSVVIALACLMRFWTTLTSAPLAIRSEAK